MHVYHEDESDTSKDSFTGHPNINCRRVHVTTQDLIEIFWGLPPPSSLSQCVIWESERWELSSQIRKFLKCLPTGGRLHVASLQGIYCLLRATHQLDTGESQLVQMGPRSQRHYGLMGEIEIYKNRFNIMWAMVELGGTRDWHQPELGTHRLPGSYDTRAES